MDFDEFIQMVEDDFNLEMHNLETKLLKIPNLHSKYLKFFYKEKGKLIELERELRELYRKKWYFYKDEYEYKLELKHIEWHIESDEEYSPLLFKFNKQKQRVDFFESLVKKSNTLSFDIKNLIEYKKFLSGVA